jgi:xylulokinase
MRHFLGIDLGLSGARAALLDGRGELRGKGRSGMGARNAPEQDPETWLAAVADAVRQALDAAGRPAVDAVGIGAFGPCAVTLDAGLKPTGPASLFAFDTRHEPWRRKLRETGIAEEALGPDHTLPKLQRLRDVEPERFQRTAFVLDATGFLVAALTGVPVMDPITRLDHALDGETPRPLPPVLPADAIAGRVTRQAAARFGIAAGTPVTVGSYDSYVDLFGAGVARAGEAGMLLGSTAVICKVAGETDELGALRATPYIGAQGKMVGGWTSSAGSLIAWADGLAGEGCRSFDPSTGSGLRMRERMPGSAGLIMLPYFAGERAPVWDAAARGALVGLTLSTTGDDIRHAALEAIALSIADITGRLDAVCGATARYLVAGGGAGIAGLAEAIASATGAELEIVADPGEAVAGAILAAHALGFPIARRVARVVKPDPAAAERYAALMEIYRPLYGQLAETMHRLGELARGGQQ